jgi:ribosomal protein S25
MVAFRRRVKRDRDTVESHRERKDEQRDRANVIAAVAQLGAGNTMGVDPVDIAREAGLGGSSVAEPILRELQREGIVHYTTGGRWKIGAS